MYAAVLIAFFALCGGHIIDIYDGCIDEGIRIVDVRHEQTAAHAADGYARQTGKLGCVVTTAGPGCTNAVTGVATAFRSESPILHIGGQSSLTQHKQVDNWLDVFNKNFGNATLDRVYIPSFDSSWNFYSSINH